MHTPELALPPIAAALRIRTATLADRLPVQAIAGPAMREFGLTPDFDTLDRELGGFGAGEAVAELVAERIEGGAAPRIVGSLILVAKAPGELKLTGFYMHPLSRGLGAGRQLLAAAIAAARAHGAQRIGLETWSHMTAAVHLYQSFGWRPIERLDPASGAEWRYELVLGELVAQGAVASPQKQ